MSRSPVALNRKRRRGPTPFISRCAAARLISRSSTAASPNQEWICRFNRSSIEGTTFRPRPRSNSPETVCEKILLVVDDPSLAGERQWTAVKRCDWLLEKSRPRSFLSRPRKLPARLDASPDPCANLPTGIFGSWRRQVRGASNVFQSARNLTPVINWKNESLSPCSRVT